MFKNSVTGEMPCWDCSLEGDCKIEEGFGDLAVAVTSSIEDLTFKCLAQKKYQCKDCGNLGGKVECGECAGGFGWPCKADKHGQHVHPEMGACIDFKKKEDSDDRK